MNTVENSVWRGGLWRTALSAAIVAGVGWLIWQYGDRLGLNTPGLKWLGIACAIMIILLLRYGGSVQLLIQQSWHRIQAKQKNENPDDEARVAKIPPRHITVGEIRATMRQLYHWRWGSKVRILLIIGQVADVEQLTPGLTRQLWQEDGGTLLLWGGDPDMPADQAWLKALRQLRHRPADGIVWVTAAFDQLPSLEPAPPSPPPSADRMDTLAQAINQRMVLLGWRLPLYVWSQHPSAGLPQGRVVQAIGCLLPAGCQEETLIQQLAALSEELIERGVQQICGDVKHHFLLMLADQLCSSPQSISTPLSILLTPCRALPLAGVIFSQPSEGTARQIPHHWGMDRRWEIIPDSVHMLPVALRPRQPGLRWRTALAPACATLMVGWAVWMGCSYFSNRNQIIDSGTAVARATQVNQPLAARLQALMELQKTVAQLQYRAEHGVPWYQRAGLSHNDRLLAALWPQYQASAQPLLRDAALTHLQVQLRAFTSLPPDSPLRDKQAKNAYDQLKLYLMLTRPAHMNAPWFSKTLLADWPVRDGVKNGVWQGVATSLLAFYGAQLAAHPGWQGAADEALISQTRALLVRLIGMRNSETGLYQKMLVRVANLYSDLRLEDMTGDTDARRLFSTDEVVPGMFTRQAWEQAVQPAIAEVVKNRRDELDWVLTDSQHPLTTQEDISPQALQQRLTERYFADFGNAWLGFLNSLRWHRAATLSDAVEQLTLMADVRQSPLVALMNTVSVQGRTGQRGEAIADSLVKSAQNLLHKHPQPVIEQNDDVHGPLDATFGPLLALLDRTRTASDAQSFQSYLTRVTQVRLRLQQVTSAADPQAMTRTLARTVFEGKSVDLTDTRDYGSLLAAGLGQEWGGFGRTVFVEPMEQAWQQVLGPAAESLNVQWQQAVVSEWNAAFGGRYPFADSASDTSLPLLARYISSDTGHISRFLQTRLNGLLHREGNHWVPDSINAQGLEFNPAFLSAINTLSQIAEEAFIAGNAGMSFELRPGTAEGVMQTDMVIDSQKLRYMNQMPEWKRFNWPGDSEAPGAELSWISTKAGTRQYADMPGSWGWIRLLDQAQVSAYPGVESSYRLSWQAPDGRSLNYILRTEAGSGPLALLKLRHFRLPEKIFSGTTPVDDMIVSVNE
ncbi:ImcF-related family protein [Enterobacteriaceae bacterium ESL0689]|nr:ImcF-related family protein [Enterobacteriaceae bacterium ESL0689]